MIDFLAEAGAAWRRLTLEHPRLEVMEELLLTAFVVVVSAGAGALLYGLFGGFVGGLVGAAALVVLAFSLGVWGLVEGFIAALRGGARYVFLLRRRPLDDDIPPPE